MKTRIFTVAVVLGILLGLPANAQTFSAGAEKTTTKADTVSQKTATLKTTAAKSTPAAKTAQAKTTNLANSSSTKPKKELDNPNLQKSVKNIGGLNLTARDKKYDNTYGHVFTFRLKDGRVEFDDNSKRQVLIWYEDFKVIKGMDGLVRCSIRVYVFNDMTERISSLGFKLIWPKIRTGVNMRKVNPGVRTHFDTMLLGDGCFTMDKTPVIEVNRCRVKGMSEEKCADAVHWFNGHS